MFLEENTVPILAIAFFITCIIEIIHLSFFVFNRDVKKKIYTGSFVYGIMVSALEVSLNLDAPNLGCSTGHIMGGTLGIIAGFYLGYQFCVLIKIIEDTRFIKLMESSNIDAFSLTESSINNIAITNVICFAFSTTACELGIFLGNVLFPM